MSAITIDIDNTVQFLVELLNVHSPTGYTEFAIAMTESRMKALNLPPGTTFTRTLKGGLMIDIPGKADDKPVGLTAHVDTLGLMVKEIKHSGRLKCTALNGIMWGGIEFEGVTVRTFDGTTIRGTMVPVNASVHVNRNIHRAERNADTMEVRLDAKVFSAEDTRGLGIAVGDFVFLDPRVEVGPRGFIRGRFLDDKASVASIFGALDALDGQPPAQSTQIFISAYEEVGHGGADQWRPDLHELIAVDMAAVGDGQDSDEYRCTICLKDSGGPYHFDTNRHLRTLALKHNIDVNVDIYPYYSSDGSAYWRAGGTARVGLIGPGVADSHSYERTHQDAIHDTALLIAHYLLEGGS